jgi:hypothetical protein
MRAFACISVQVVRALRLTQAHARLVQVQSQEKLVAGLGRSIDQNVHDIVKNTEKSDNLLAAEGGWFGFRRKANSKPTTGGGWFGSRVRRNSLWI